MTEQKKILYVITKSNWGGAQRAVFDLALGLKNEAEVVIALGGDGALKEKLVKASLKTIPLKNAQRDVSLWPEILLTLNLLKIYQKICPEIIHLHSSKIGGLGSLAGRVHNLWQFFKNKKRAKIIFTVHGWAFGEPRPIWQKALIWLSSLLTVIFSHKIICVSENDFRRTPLLFLFRPKIHLIYNGIEKPNFLNKKEAQEKLFQLAQKTDTAKELFVFGTIAELHPNKGLDNLLRAFSALKKTHPNFVCFFAGAGEARENLLRLTAAAHLEENCFFLGHLEEAVTFLKGFDCFVLPSRKEGLPYTILEARAAKIKIIATDVGGIKEALKNYPSSKIIPKENHSALLLALKEAATEPSLKIEKDSEEFDLITMRQKTYALY